MKKCVSKQSISTLYLLNFLCNKCASTREIPHSMVCMSWRGGGVGQRGRAAGIFQGLAFLTDSFLSPGPHRKLSCPARPTKRLLGALGDLSPLLPTRASFCSICALPVYLSSSVVMEGVCEKNI